MDDRLAWRSRKREQGSGRRKEGIGRVLAYDELHRCPVLTDGG
jgi:hypothetical protein